MNGNNVQLGIGTASAVTWAAHDRSWADPTRVRPMAFRPVTAAVTAADPAIAAARAPQRFPVQIRELRRH
ncbi:hypothetical protein GORHZ_028_00520 [Gordonia rhizosphera NBRC 16068]|uniref:Uncharacterized protein n=1 Tax=Gordonia rhizosphera NBRC 16068 TaxID=1108045 RepID=K6UYP5_9ACTN|nr:hypothetical protein GORHZ_028_00520 [Gordonia rhizosphera NBRC 16068]